MRCSMFRSIPIARPGIPEGFMSMLSRIMLLGNESIVSDIMMKHNKQTCVRKFRGPDLFEIEEQM